MAVTRKIIHVDMDAFFASVALREAPHLRGLPVAVAWEGARSVVCAASYEARQFGVHSAMSVARARRLCRNLVLVSPDFALYRAVSRQVHGVFARYTDVVEPISLDEAYLDVTVNKRGWAYASDVAWQIRRDIWRETGLTASAGIAPNKFLAKIASDWRKPDGQFVIAPHQVADFVYALPLAKITGVGKKTAAKMAALGWHTAGDLLAVERAVLVHWFGRWGHRLYDLARGVDARPVAVRRERVQISSELTLAQDVPWADLAGFVPPLAEDVWAQMQARAVVARTLTVKVKTGDFRVMTRSQTFSSPLPDVAALVSHAQAVLARLPQDEHYRLVGVGVGQLQAAGQQGCLFEI